MTPKTTHTTTHTENYFHAYTGQFTKRCKTAVILVDVPLFQLCVICIVDMLLNFRKLGERQFLSVMCGIVLGSVLVGTLFTLVCFYLMQKAVKRHSRYTYFDIEQRVMIFSMYGGEYYSGGKRTINRELYVMPFSEFQSVERDPKKKTVTIKGEIRVYYLPSDDLGYHIKDGNIAFDHWWLDGNNYKVVSELEINNCFERVKLLESSINAAFEDFKQIPPPKPFVLENTLYKPKKRLSVSNKLLSLPSYDRKW